MKIYRMLVIKEDEMDEQGDGHWEAIRQHLSQYDIPYHELTLKKPSDEKETK